MSHLIIERNIKISNYGTFGRCTIDGKYQGITVEQPYNDNKPFVSCIPDGDYKLLKYESPKYGDIFVAVNPALDVYAFEDDAPGAEDRDACLFFHPGSYPHNFQGCCGIGNKLSMDGNGRLYVQGTRVTSEKVVAMLLKAGDEHTLSIFSTPPNLYVRNP